jgi:ketosteroid isomerase-like protein
VIVRIRGRAKASGVPVEAVTAQIWTWRDGKMWRNQVFADPREALEAVGLRE